VAFQRADGGKLDRAIQRVASGDGNSVTVLDASILDDQARGAALDELKTFYRLLPDSAVLPALPDPDVPKAPAICQ
jgi:hypothetical protein